MTINEMSPALAVLWQFWRRNRWGFTLSAAYVLAAAVAVRLLPEGLRGMSMGDGDRPLIADWLGLPCVFVLMHVLAVFTTSEGGLKESGIAQHTFVLPVSSRALVAPPMIAGCVTMAAAWWAIVLLVLRPAGVQAHLAWPAAALAMGLAVLQVGSWVPLAQSWLRVVFTPVLITGVILGSLMLHLFVPEAVLAASMLATLPLLYAAAVHSVAMARRGDAYDWRAWRRLVERFANWRQPATHPFRSAAGAQLWFEWRAHGWFLPLTLTLLIVFTVPLLAFADQTNVEAGWRFLWIIVLMPTVFAMMIGGQVGRQDMWSDYPMTPFLAARPLSTWQLVAAKFKMCLGCTLVGFVLTLLGVLALLLRPGFAAHALDVAGEVGVGRSIAIVVAASLGLIALTWLQMASNAWVSLTGRVWLINFLSFTFAGVIGVGTLGGVFLYVYELHGYVEAAVPWMMWSIVAVKPVLAIAVLAGLLRTGLIGPSHAAAMVGVWCLVAGGLCLAVWLLAPAGVVSLETAAAVVVIGLPFSRLAGAPLALYWNRHR